MLHIVKRATTPLITSLSILFILLLVPDTHSADDQPSAAVFGESRSTASRLAEADRRLSGKRLAEGLDELKAVLDNAGDDLAPVDASHSVRARWLVHARIAALPAAELQRYRDRVEIQARRWLEQGTAAHDANMLRKLVDEAFCSRPAERALEILGDLAFERGQFVEAASWWHLLLPRHEGANRSDELVYPGPLRDAARVRAKQLMALYFQGELDGKDPLLKAYTERFGDAEGVLGGRRGKYSAFLTDLCARPVPSLVLEPASVTFAGDASRGKVQPAPSRLLDRLSVVCRAGPSMRIGLPSFAISHEPSFDLDATVDAGRLRQRSDLSRSLSFHPLIVDGKLLIADTGRVLAFDLHHPGAPGVELYSLGFSPVKPRLDVRCTLTVADGCVYARLGNPRVDEKAATSTITRESKGVENRIVCLSLDARSGESPIRWVELGLSGKNTKLRGRVIFEGAPVVRDGRVYVAATRFEGGKAITSILCYAAEPAARTVGEQAPEPRLLWHTDICELRDSGPPRVRHHLLTLAGPLVVCCTRAGVTVAVDAVTGLRAWAAHGKGRFQEFDERPVLTDLIPCVYAAGKIYAVPTEGAGLVCVDAESGRPVWQREAIDVVHLLGVASGRLIVTTPTGMRALGAENGSDTDGWSREARTEYGRDGARTGWTPAGRGFLAGAYVFWPVIDPEGNAAVHALRQDTGEPDDNPTLLHRIPAGNILYAEDCLAVAGPNELTVFTPPAWQLSERVRGANANPENPRSVLALARSEADASLYARADLNYRRLHRLTHPGSRIDALAKEERQQMWLEAGRRLLAASRLESALSAFRSAASKEFAPEKRAAVLLEAAEELDERGLGDQRDQVLFELSGDEELREARLSDFARVGDRIGVRFNCPASCQRMRSASEAALAVAKSSEELDSVALRFPATAAAQVALERVARQREDAGRFGAAADAWRRRIAAHDAPASAFVSLARCYEREGCSDAARSAWLALDRAYGEETISEITSNRRVTDFVAERLRSLPSEPSQASLPLRQAWDLILDKDETPVSAPGSDLFVTTRRVGSSEICVRDIASGRERWRASVPFTPKQSFCYADLLIVAGAEGVQALRRDDGGNVWKCVSPVGQRNQAMRDFRLVGSRLSCRHGDQALLAIDVETGAARRFTTADANPGPRSPYKTLLPFYFAGNGHLLAQTIDGVCHLFQTSAGGLEQSPITRGEWSADPVAVGQGEASVSVAGARQVVFSGDSRSRPAWTYSLTGITTLSGRPSRVAVAGDAVLLLIEANIGFQLQRLRSQDGRPGWPMPVLLEEPVSDPAGWAADEGTVYLVERGVLIARSLQNGKILWGIPLGSSSRQWRVQRLANGLIVYPSAITARQFSFRWLNSQLQWNVVPDAGEAIGNGYPVVCCDLGGRILQRFDLVSRGTFLRRDNSTSLGFDIAPSAGMWRGIDPSCQPVQASSRGIVVVVGPRAWGLVPATAK
jgi:outer membrane protein assembly factor BamB